MYTHILWLNCEHVGKLCIFITVHISGLNAKLPSSSLANIPLLQNITLISYIKHIKRIIVPRKPTFLVQFSEEGKY